ncbi:MAG: hypothetical protein H7328_10220 [Bdellovibrio sp.]|nr:hypothetical protein [Bdellovibrio sp.]
MIKRVALATFLFSVILTLACYIAFDLNNALSCALGASVMLINLVGIWFGWKLVFLKKSIALAVLVIIFKYLILGLILWNFTQYQWLQPIGFIVGLSSLMFGVISSVFLKKFL